MRPTHLLIALIPSIVWGLNFITSAHALSQLEPFGFTALRMAIVLALLLPFLRLPPRDQWWRLAAVAVCNGALHFGISFYGLQKAEDVSSVAIALQSYVPMTTLLSVWLLGERIGRVRSAAIVIAFIGVLVVGFDPRVLRHLDALAYTLVSAFFLALGTVLMRPLRGVGLFELQAWTAALALPVLVLLAFAFEGNPVPSFAAAHWTHWGAGAYSAVFASILGHGAVYWLIQRHPVSQITPLLLLTPVIAVTLGVLVWGDSLSWRLLVGGSLVLTGVLIIALRSAHAARVRTAPAS